MAGARARDASERFPEAPLSVRACCWNLGGRPLAAEDDLGSLLAPEGVAADLYAVGFQEVVELNVGNIFLASGDEEEEIQLSVDTQVAEELQRRTGLRYTRVACVGMVGLLLLVYLREDLASLVEEVCTDCVKTGVFHLAGNKGAACLRFELAGYTFCFINVHLHAGQEQQATRNQDIDDVLRYAFQPHGMMRFPHDKFERESNHLAPLHHFVVMFGDFNFRLDIPEGQMPTGDPIEWLEHDQFRKGQMDGLDGFSEGSIRFPPTYRYVVGTDEFDAKRSPAWCDRVLYKAMPNLSVRLRSYSSRPELKHTSDHRPVAANLEVRRKVSEEAIDQPPATRSSRSWLSALVGWPDPSPVGGRTPPQSACACFPSCCGPAMQLARARSLSLR